MNDVIGYVTLVSTIQVGPDSFNRVAVSRPVSNATTILELLEWARDMGCSNPSVNDLQWSTHNE